MIRPARVVALMTVAALAVTVVGCGSDTTPDSNALAEDAARLRIPSQVVGLTVTFEEIPQRGIEAVDRPYVDSVAVFSIREGETLRGTLQVTRLNRRARPGDRDFRGQIVEQISAVEPTQLRVGDQTVYATGGAEQDVYVWFEGRGLLVLAVHEGFPFPRTLLRRMLETEMGL